MDLKLVMSIHTFDSLLPNVSVFEKGGWGNDICPLFLQSGDYNNALL